MLTTIFLVLSVLALLWMLGNVVVAIYIKYKNPDAKVSIGAIAYVLPIVFLLATMVARSLKL